MSDDARMLSDLLDDGRLEERERKAFTDMSFQVEAGRALTEKQHELVASRWERLGHGVEGAADLFSSGKVAPANPDSPDAVTFPGRGPDTRRGPSPWRTSDGVSSIVP